MRHEVIPSPWSVRVASLVVRRRAVIAVAWSVVALLVLPQARRLEGKLDVSARIRGSESDSVTRLLVERFASPWSKSAVLVAAGLPSPLTHEGQDVIDSLAAAVSRVAGVTSVLASHAAADSALVGINGASSIVAGLGASRFTPDQIVPRLRAATESVQRRYPAAELSWTGEDALNFDLRAVSSAGVSRAERIALPLTVVLLALAFGTVAAAVIPVVFAGLTIGLALGAAAFVVRLVPLSIVVENVISMLGLGLGIDYTLLLVSRFRESLDAGHEPEHAAIEAAVNAGHSVVVSAAAVIIGFASLLVVDVPDLRSIAVGGLLVVSSSALIAITIVPGLLSWLGHRVNAGRVHHLALTGNSRRWKRWAARIARHPGATLTLAGIPLLMLSGESLRIKPNLPRGDWLPRVAESARGMRALRAMGRSGQVQALRVIVVLPGGETALAPAAWAATARIAAAIEQDGRVAHVRSLQSITGAASPDALLSFFPDGLLRTFVSRDQRLTLLEVVPKERVDGEDLPSLARNIRGLDVQTAGGLAGVRLLVGGVPALNADYADAINRRAPLAVALVLGGTFVALMIGFRSLLVPLKAIMLNLLSVCAALGVVVLVFQDGYGTRLLGLDGPLDGVFAAVPLLVFCVVFGLSMDYEVFLISRVAEARRRGASESGALVAGIARSGRVITSAAAIMVVVFAAFALGDFVLIQILGVALASAVVLDATLVRLAVGPGLLAIAGRWNWWPGDRFSPYAYKSARDRGTDADPSGAGLASSV